MASPMPALAAVDPFTHEPHLSHASASPSAALGAAPSEVSASSLPDSTVVELSTESAPLDADFLRISPHGMESAESLAPDDIETESTGSTDKLIPPANTGNANAMHLLTEFGSSINSKFERIVAYAKDKGITRAHVAFAVLFFVAIIVAACAMSAATKATADAATAQQSVAAALVRITALEASAATAVTSVTEGVTLVNQLLAQQAQTNATLAVQQTTITSQQATITSQQATIEQLKSQVADNTGRIVHVHSLQTDAATAIGVLAAAQNATNASITMLGFEVIAMNASITGLVGAQDATSTAVAAQIAMINSTTLASIAQLSSAIAAGSVPIGAIVPWTGTIASIPAGFHLCDGSVTPTGLTTPDLRSRFVVGASADGTSPSSGLTSRAAGEQGGEESHTLTTAEMPSHAHGNNYVAEHNRIPMYSSWGQAAVSGSIQSLTADWGGTNGGTGAVSMTSFVGGTATIQSTSPGVTSAHNNMPPYYALLHIMRC
eukprot:m.31113 g.31113  ORF g.31113 m.31113 type:complete len:492 (-) comp4848_c0_seq1:176-1651(-)